MTRAASLLANRLRGRRAVKEAVTKEVEICGTGAITLPG